MFQQELSQRITCYCNEVMPAGLWVYMGGLISNENKWNKWVIRTPEYFQVIAYDSSFKFEQNLIPSQYIINRGIL